jgi:hypothetical protein
MKGDVKTACAHIASDLGASDSWSALGDGDEAISNANGTGACDVANTASAHVLEKAGLKRTATLDRHKQALGKWWTSFFYDFHPLDVVGWKGDLAPLRFNVRDLRCVVSMRAQLPPTVHATFVGRGVGVFTFVPRPFPSEPDVLRVPYYHRNVDNDESVFVHHDESGSRKPGMLSHTPQGILHGADEATRAAFQKRDEEDRLIGLTRVNGRTRLEDLWANNRMRLHFGAAIRIANLVIGSSGGPESSTGVGDCFASSGSTRVCPAAGAPSKITP